MNERIVMAAGAGEIPVADATRTVLCPRRAHAKDLKNVRVPAPAGHQRKTRTPVQSARRAGGNARVPRMLTHLKPLPKERQVVHVEPWSKVMLVMLDRHVAYLDILSVLIRLRRRKALSRAELVRAFIEFMERSGIDFTRFATLDEMIQYLVAHFRSVNRTRLPLLIESGLFHQERPAQEPGTPNVAAP